MILYYSIILLGILGIFIAGYIFYEKNFKKVEEMICPLNGDCKTVITSSYSKIFGIPMEILGILYYLFMVLAYAIINYIQNIDPIFLKILFGISGFSFLFSIYLTYVQIKILKEICTWCIGSAIISTLIFILSWFTI